MSTVASRFTTDKGISSTSTTSLDGDVPPLGAPLGEKKSLFQRARPVEKDAVATQVRHRKQIVPEQRTILTLLSQACLMTQILQKSIIHDQTGT